MNRISSLGLDSKPVIPCYGVCLGWFCYFFICALRIVINPCYARTNTIKNMELWNLVKQVAIFWFNIYYLHHPDYPKQNCPKTSKVFLATLGGTDLSSDTFLKVLLRPFKVIEVKGRLWFTSKILTCQLVFFLPWKDCSYVMSVWQKLLLKRLLYCK